MPPNVGGRGAQNREMLFHEGSECVFSCCEAIQPLFSRHTTPCRVVHYLNTLNFRCLFPLRNDCPDRINDRRVGHFGINRDGVHIVMADSHSN